MDPVKIFGQLKQDAMQYLGLSRQAFDKKITRGLIRDNAKLWNDYFKNKKMDERSVKQFYASHPSYMEQLLSWHCNEQWQGHWQGYRYAHGRILQFGGGLGTMSFITAQNCEGVTRDYLDINEKMRDFVRFRIRKRDIKNINVVDRPTGRYGAIYCIDVLEHLVDWKSTVQALVKDHTEVGSYFVHNSPFGRTSEHPMHFGSDVGVPYVLYPYGFRAVKGNYDVLERKR